MPRFTRIDKYDKLADLIVPPQERWLAIDTNQFAIGNGVSPFGILEKFDYDEYAGDLDYNWFFDPNIKVYINGDRDTVKFKNYLNTDPAYIPELNEVVVHPDYRFLYIGDGVTPLSDLKPIKAGGLNKFVTIEVTGDVEGQASTDFSEDTPIQLHLNFDLLALLDAIREIDGHLSGIDADTVDSYHVGSEISPNTIPVRDVDGKLPGDITGNAPTASKLMSAKQISLSGDVSGQVDFDGSSDVSIETTVADDSHKHSLSTLVGIETAHVASADYADNADTVDNYHASTEITPNTIPVRDADGKLTGDITGDATTLNGKTSEAFVTRVGSANSLGVGLFADLPRDDTPEAFDLYFAVDVKRLYYYEEEVGWKDGILTSVNYIDGGLLS